MAEGRYYHASWGVMEREDAGLPVTESHFRAHLPPAMQRVAVLVSNSWTSESSSRNHSPLRRLSEFGCKVHDPGLPGWNVFIRGPANCERTVPATQLR